MKGALQEMKKGFILVSICIMTYTTAYSDNFKMPKIEGMPKKPKIVLATVFKEYLPGLKTVAKDFEKETGIELEVEGMENSQLPMWMRCHFMSKDPCTVLIVRKPNLIDQFGRAGLLKTFNSELKKPNIFLNSKKPWDKYFFLANLKKVISFDGKYYKVPFTQYGVAFFYNIDTYEKYNLKVPKHGLSSLLTQIKLRKMEIQHF